MLEVQDQEALSLEPTAPKDEGIVHVEEENDSLVEDLSLEEFPLGEHSNPDALNTNAERQIAVEVDESYASEQTSLSIQPTLSVQASGETEPNDDSSSATAISVNSNVSGSFYRPGSSADYDWYRLALASATRVSLAVSTDVVMDSPGWNDSNDLRVQIYSAKTLETTDDYDYSWNVRGTKKWSSGNLYLPKGTYLIYCKSAHSKLSHSRTEHRLAKVREKRNNERHQRSRLAPRSNQHQAFKQANLWWNLLSHTRTTPWMAGLEEKWRIKRN